MITTVPATAKINGVEVPLEEALAELRAPGTVLRSVQYSVPEDRWYTFRAHLGGSICWWLGWGALFYVGPRYWWFFLVAQVLAGLVYAFRAGRGRK